MVKYEKILTPYIMKNICDLNYVFNYLDARRPYSSTGYTNTILMLGTYIKF